MSAPSEPASSPQDPRQPTNTTISSNAPASGMFFCTAVQEIRDAREAWEKGTEDARWAGSDSSSWGRKRRAEYLASIDSQYRARVAALAIDRNFRDLIDYLAQSGHGDLYTPGTDLQPLSDIYVEAARLVPSDGLRVTIADGLLALREQDRKDRDCLPPLPPAITEPVAQTHAFVVGVPAAQLNTLDRLGEAAEHVDYATIEAEDARRAEMAQRADETRGKGIGWVAGILKNHAIFCLNSETGVPHPKGVLGTWYDHAERLWSELLCVPGFDRLAAVCMAETGGHPTEQWVKKQIGALALRLNRSPDDVWRMALTDALVDLGWSDVPSTLATSATDQNGSRNTAVTSKIELADQAADTSAPDLTPRQREIYAYLYDQARTTRIQPTVREIAEHFGIKSPNGVMGHLKALERKGWIESSPDSHSRSRKLLRKPDGETAGQWVVVIRHATGQDRVCGPYPDRDSACKDGFRLARQQDGLFFDPLRLEPPSAGAERTNGV